MVITNGVADPMNAVFFTAEIKADYNCEAEMKRQANIGGHTNYTQDAICLQRLNSYSTSN